MMKKCFLIGLLAILFTGLGGTFGCAGGSSPSSVVKDFYTAINEGELGEANRYTAITTRIQEGYDITELSGWISGIEILEEKREKAFGEEVAQIEVNISLKSGAEQQLPPYVIRHAGRHVIYLERYNGQWKIVFRS